MCIFSGPVDDVSDTSIYASELADGRHCTVYEMKVAAQSEVAMILPIPAASAGSFEFIDLEAFPTFFRELERLYPQVQTLGRRSRGGDTKSAAPLPVVEVGQYVASFVPSQKDFKRLDARFRLPLVLWKDLPDYSKFSFAVFQLKVNSDSKKFHPMAYKYRPLDRDRLFFPTAHVHDGHVPRVTHYDHHLYYQVQRGWVAAGEWQTCEHLPPSAKFRLAEELGILQSEQAIDRRWIVGLEKNVDYYLQRHDQQLATTEVTPARILLQAD